MEFFFVWPKKSENIGYKDYQFTFNLAFRLKKQDEPIEKVNIFPFFGLCLHIFKILLCRNMQTCPDLHKRAQIPKNLFRSPITCVDSLKLEQILTNLCRNMQTCTDLLKLVQICGNSYRFVKTCIDSQICSNWHTFSWTSTESRKLVQIYVNFAQSCINLCKLD